MFNSSFPTALAAYMHFQGKQAKYLYLKDDLDIEVNEISINNLFGIDPLDKNAYYSFESTFMPYQRHAIGDIPRVDLVIMQLGANGQADKCIAGLEVKLTAIPDNTTCNKNYEDYGSEIVVRPPTISYLAYSIADSWEDRRDELLKKTAYVNGLIDNWHDATEVVPRLPQIVETLNEIILNTPNQKPILMQPIWKTEGKSALLAEDCLDIFVWSDLAFSKLFINSINISTPQFKMTRQSRTAVWLLKMLHEFARTGKIDHSSVVDSFTYNVKNDKAFAISGSQTNKYMKCDELTHPRIQRNELKNIILGGGHQFLSPERRFDAFIVYTPGLFD
ncbi:HindVP family restriction endonuclease [Listeria seeligeri]|nr:HindVP family restriction endonuclease [Listeria seeligeri]